MQGLHKISPLEFRLPNKAINLTLSPSNYYEKFKYEIFLQKVLYSYYITHGVLIFIQQFNASDKLIIFQFFFYRTVDFFLPLIQKPYTKHLSFKAYKKRKRRKKRGRQSRKKRFKKIRRLKHLPKKCLKLLLRYFHWSHTIYTYWTSVQKKGAHRLYLLRNWIQSQEKIPRYQQYWLLSTTIFLFRPRSLRVSRIGEYTSRPIFLRYNYYRKVYRLWWLARKNSRLRYSKIARYFGFQFFFCRLFNYYFSKQSVILYKSLYKLLTCNRIFKRELKQVLYHLRYFTHTQQLFDIVISTHYIFMFANTNFLFPLFIQNLVWAKKQVELVVMLFNLLRTFFVLKKNLRAINIFIKGTYDKHARLRSTMYSIGDLALSHYHSAIIYDVLQCPTFYGMFFLKLWIYWEEKKSQFDEIV